MPQILSDEEQQLTLEYILNDRKLFITSLSILKPQYFSPPLDRAVEFAADYFHTHHAIPDFDMLRAKTGASFSKREVMQDEFDYCLGEIENHCRLAAVKLAFMDCIDRFDSGDISGIEQQFRDAIAVSIHTEIGVDQFEDPRTRLERMKVAIDTRHIGIAPIDRLLDGVQRRTLNIVAATSAAGKSLMLANIATAMAKQTNDKTGKKLNALILSLELDEDLIAKRMDSIITGIESYEIFNNIDAVVELLAEKKDRYGSIITRKMKNGSNANDIRNVLMEYHLQFGCYPDVLCVDYLDLMKPINIRNRDGRFDIDKDISEELREVFVEFDAYGFSASQLNRDGADIKDITYKHIAGGLSKINTCDTMFVITPPDENEDGEDTGERTIKQLKIRNGARRSKPETIYLCPKTLRFTENPVQVGPGIIGKVKQEKNETANERIRKMLREKGTTTL